MYKITILGRDENKKTVVLTQSIYPTKESALSAAETLRLLSSKKWTKACRDVQCERKGADKPTWLMHSYTVTEPEEITSVK